MSENLTSMEKRIIEAIFNCTDISSNITKLYKQYKKAKVIKRTFTNVGFFTEFIVTDSNLKLQNHVQLELGGVYAEIKGLKHGASFVLYIRNGAIKTLETYCYDESWPENAEIINFFRIEKNGTLNPLDKRDKRGKKIRPHVKAWLLNSLTQQGG